MLYRVWDVLYTKHQTVMENRLWEKRHKSKLNSGRQVLVFLISRSARRTKPRKRWCCQRYYREIEWPLLSQVVPKDGIDLRGNERHDVAKIAGPNG